MNRPMCFVLAKGNESSSVGQMHLKYGDDSFLTLVMMMVMIAMMLMVRLVMVVRMVMVKIVM